MSGKTRTPKRNFEKNMESRSGFKDNSEDLPGERAEVRTDDEKSGFIDIGKGVEPACVLSP